MLWWITWCTLSVGTDRIVSVVVMMAVVDAVGIQVHHSGKEGMINQRGNHTHSHLKHIDPHGTD